MAVAVKNNPEATKARPLDPVAIGSLLGALYVLGSIAIVFYAIPTLWGMTIGPWMQGGLSFVGTALHLLLIVAACVGLFLFGQRLAGPTIPVGMRAGIFTAIVGILVIGLLTRGIGLLLERYLLADSKTIGLAVMGAVGLGLLGVGAWWFVRPATRRFLLQFEAQGWFTRAAYKRSQGQRVRRATILGLLVLAGCGIYTLLAHKTLATGNPNWEVTIPFTEGRVLVLLPDIQFTVPLLLGLAALWLSYRIVNFPTFADFLIATEAEMNKVSWPTRKRLVQDTIVVLTSVVLITTFIFLVDLLWGWGLMKVGVLRPPPKSQQESKVVGW